LQILHWTVMKKLLLIVSILVSGMLNAQNSDSLSLDSLLNMSLSDLLNVRIISATQTPQTVLNAPSIITIITKNQIDNRGYKSVAEALGSIAGLDVIYDYMGYNIGVRGVNAGMRGSSRILKIMINGHAVASKSGSENFTGSELIPINAVERIEIIRGPGSALYGANAFLGVINIITKSATAETQGAVGISGAWGSNYRSQMYEMMFQGSSKKIEYLISGQYAFADRSGLSPVNIPGQQIFKSGKTVNDISQPLSLFAQFSYVISKEDLLRLEFNHQNMNTSGEFSDWGVLTHNNQIQISNTFLATKYTKKFNHRLQSDIDIVLSNVKPGKNDKLDNDTNTNDYITRNFGCSGIDLVAKTNFKISKQSNITFGIDFSNDLQNLQTYYYANNSGVKTPQQGINYGDTSFINTGSFLQSIMYLSDYLENKHLSKISLTAGLRFDYQNIYKDAFNYRLGLVYNFSEFSFIKLLHGTSYKAPSSIQLFTNQMISGGIIGNSQLKPENARTTELAFGIKIMRNLNFNTTLFLNNIQNKVELILPYGTITNVTYGNVARIQSAGTEIEWIYSVKSFFSYFNFSYQRSIIEKENLEKDKILLKTELYPDLMLKGGVNLPISKLKINFNIEAQYISKRIASQQNSYIYDPINFRINRYALNDYFVCNGSVSTKDIKILKNNILKFQLKVFNLLDKKYSFPGFSNYDIPAPGRIFDLSLSFQF